MPKRFLLSLILTACLVLVCHGVRPVAAAEPIVAEPVGSDQPWPFKREARGAVVSVDEGGVVGLYNDHIGVLLRRSDATVLGVWSPGRRSLVDNTTQISGRACLLWTARLRPADRGELIAVQPGDDTRVGYRFDRREDGRLVLQVRFMPASPLREGCRATASVALGPGDTQLRWRISVQPMDRSASIWEVTYPRFFVKAADEAPEGNRMLFPYRRGRLMGYGKAMPRYRLDYPYPGPGVKFQLTGVYGEQSGEGYYFAAHDGEGYDKVFNWDNRPERGGMLMGLTHLPADRGLAGTGFDQPYDVVTQPFRGDWWHAARIYRQWWTQQVWASNDLLRDRKDIPDELKYSMVMTRPSTTVKTRTVEGNVRGLRALRQIVGDRPIVGTWYGAFECLGVGCALDQTGHGHLRAVEPEVTSAVQDLKGQDVHLLAYIQSIIYHNKLETLRPEFHTPAYEADIEEAGKWVARDIHGEPILYSAEHLPLYAMDRGTTWWQDRLIEQAKRAMEAGFSGIYLDSFGKSSHECFDPDHGHAIGGGNAGIAGQREMARRMLEAIREIHPGAVLSGEAPVEAFRDLVQVNLQAVNIYEGYVPVMRTIWGDYSLHHGRTVRAAKQGPENLIPELSLMFLEGTMIGRIFTDSGHTIFNDPATPPEVVDHFKQIVVYGEAGMDYLRFGEYLHPLHWKEPLPTVTFHESAQFNEVTQPAVMHSVVRHHGDGSVAIVLVNVDTRPHALEVPIDPSLRAGKAAQTAQATLWRMNARGQREQVSQGSEPWHERVELQPREIVFFILN